MNLSGRHRVGFTVNASRVGTAGGLRTFTLSLLNCLVERHGEIEVVLPSELSDCRYIRAIHIPKWFGSSSRVSRLRPVLWMLYCLCMFPVKRGRPLLSTTHHGIPFRKGQILTVHDLRPLHLPDTWTQYLYFRYLLPRSLRKCDGILTVSEATKKEIVSTYNISPSKVYVVPNAITTPLESLPLDAEERQHPYLLMVGASWPHKNAEELLLRHHLWRERYSLKIVAGPGQYTDRLQKLTNDLGIRDNVRFLEKVSDEKLHSLYAGCAALVYPSKMEGFGIPPLEAMSYGRPVISSDLPVFREILGDCPFYVQLGDETSWEQAFEQLAASRNAPQKRKAAQERAATYSISRMSHALAEALLAIWGVSSIS